LQLESSCRGGEGRACGEVLLLCPFSVAGRREEDEDSRRRHQISQSPLISFLLTLARRGRFPLPPYTPSISLPGLLDFLPTPWFFSHAQKEFSI
jgi:hypothetical protein